MTLDRETRRYLAYSYPHNHDYWVVGRRLVPKWRLWRRAGALWRHLPEPCTSLLDVSSCKGWFVTRAAQRMDCERALGIDVHEPDLAASRAVAAHVGAANARFEKLFLHELAERIDAFGGPFDATLLVNTYPYLFFGSRREAHGYGDHDAIFRMLRTVTKGRVVFGNRVDLALCPRNVRERAAESGLAAEYDEARITAAAERYFQVRKVGAIGRIPLWILKV
ncbi:MAG: hypothetical protein R3F34_05595 [Planctomycetota bacterium]